MISEWMDNGNIIEFLQNHKEVNRLQLVSTQVAVALLTEVDAIGFFSW